MDLDTTATKEANVDYDVHELIRRRWSPRAFSDRPVDSELLRQLFEAARWTPSSFNEQPWRFLVATRQQPEEYEKLSQVLNEFNRSWATTAPVLILAVKKDHFAADGRPNHHAAYDLGQAMAFLTLEATRHDLFVHQMAGILPDRARELLDIPEGYTPTTMAALGYLGDPEVLPEKLRSQEQNTERQRLDLEEVAFRGTWSEPEAI